MASPHWPEYSHAIFCSDMTMTELNELLDLLKILIRELSVVRAEHSFFRGDYLHGHHSSE